MEAAGLVLGAIPIGIWALEHYQEPLEAYTDYHNTINTLKVNLQIQKMHLDTTLLSIGLRDPTPEELRACLRAKFPGRHEELLFIIAQMDELTAGLMANLMVDMNRKPSWTDEPPDRASWEWRRVKRSFSTKKRTRILMDLRNWNDDLRNLIERAEVPAADDGSAAVERVRMRFNRQRCDALRASVGALHRAVRAGVAGCNGQRHEAGIEMDWEAVPRFTVCLLHGQSPLETWRCFHAAGDGGTTNGHASQPSLTAPPMAKARTPSPRRLKIASILGRAKKPVTTTPTVTVTQASQTVTLTSTVDPSPDITDLCSIASTSSTQPTALGVLQDPVSRAGTPDSASHFSLSHAKDRANIVWPLDLKGLLAETQWGVDHGLSAQQRYALAAAIAKAVLYLSNSPWLDDEWASDQVKFLLHQNPSSNDSLPPHAFLAHAFDSAAQSTSSTFTHLIPNRLIFTLGILLVELAINEVFHHASLETILQGDYPTLRRKLDRVYREAGSLYGNAAQRCVNCEFMGPSSGVDLGLPGFRQQFHDTVVAPLQATYEVFSTLYTV